MFASPTKITFTSNGIASGFNETRTIDVRWSTAFSMFNCLTFKAFFKLS